MIGKTLDRYRIDAELGAGGMGVVYRAFDTQLEREVALKVVSQKLASDAKAHMRLIREARAASSLNHPHICIVHEVGSVDGTSFIVMEYVRGTPLNQVIGGVGLPRERLLRYAIQITDAVAHAHSRGIIHRDLKSLNILITEDDRVKVLDFGLAKKMLLQQDSGREDTPTASFESLTDAGVVVGTLHYLAPETLRGQRADPLSDIWAIGIILYEMAAGKLPFNGRTAFEISSEILTGSRITISSEDLPDALKSTIEQCLERDRSLRFPDASQLLGALKQVEKTPSTTRTPIVESASGNTIAVLDFVNLSGDTSVDWLSGGIAETITVDLKRISSLKVIPRERILKCLGSGSGKSLDEDQIIQIAQQLGSRVLVAGSFQKSGNQIRITSRFLEARKAEWLKSMKIDGSMENIFALQDQIIAELIPLLNVEVESSELSRIGKPETEMLEAYEYYARGRQIFNQFRATSFDEAAQWFQKALDTDPDYAFAYSGLGSSLVFRFIALTDHDSLQKGIGHLKRATELDPDFGEPYSYLAYALGRTSLDLQGAIKAGSRAIELEPDNGAAHYFLGAAYHAAVLVAHQTSRFADALQQYLATIKLLPEYQAALMGIGELYRLNGRLEDAHRFLERAVAVEDSQSPTAMKFVGALALMSHLLLQQGDIGEAEEWMKRSLARLEKTDHVYKNAFLGLTRLAKAEIHFRRSEFDQAAGECKKVHDIVQSSARAVGIGFLFVQARVLHAISFRGLQMFREAKHYFQEALDTFNNRRNFDFNWIWRGSDADAHYSIARYHALSSSTEDAIAALHRSIECGGLNSAAIERDPAFALLLDSQELQQTFDLLRARVTEVNLTQVNG